MSVYKQLSFFFCFEFLPLAIVINMDYLDCELCVTRHQMKTGATVKGPGTTGVKTELSAHVKVAFISQKTEQRRERRGARYSLDVPDRCSVPLFASSGQFVITHTV